MATIVLGVVGAVLGGPWGFEAGVLLGSWLFPQKLPAQERGKLDDLGITASAYGVMIPIVYGVARVPGNMIWATDLVEHFSEHQEGGKGGGGVTVRDYTYTVSFAAIVCEGAIFEIKRIWAEDILIYELGESEYTIRVYTGTEVQTADPLIAGIEGSANTPAYRGLAYVVFENLDLSQWGNRIPNLSFELFGLPGGLYT